ncbi:WD40/YVTN/BNR-like repeat-containing protein [Legionella bozemanae]|uniref:WD40/YVTN/BNR-like repeat-containing protein n=1 Tax=Legionella bozemanae TaxID=447 RepID=UPI00399D1E70
MGLFTQTIKSLAKFIRFVFIIFFLIASTSYILSFLLASKETKTLKVPKIRATENQLKNFTSTTLSKGWFEHLSVVNTNIFYASGINLVNKSPYSFYKSTDGGLTWDSMKTPFSTSISVINKDILYVGSLKFGVGKTVDGGKTWSPTNLSNVDILQVQALDSNSVYALTSNKIGFGGSLFQTNDGGTTWKKIYSSIWTVPLTFYAVNSKIIYLGLSHGFINNSKILKTTDGGISWDTVFVGSNKTSIDTLYYKENTLFATTSEGLLKTLDGGKNWYLITKGLPRVFESKIYYFPKITALNSQEIILSSPALQSIYVTYNGGSSWQNIPINKTVHDITTFNNIIYVGTQGSLIQLQENP